ncbi:MAG: hypothetical protein L0Y70_06825 [Gemmataceae bacterium]|nr:hypothetical protein [Gemmataceae bacterium]
MRQVHVIAGLVLAGAVIWSLCECATSADDQFEDALVKSFACRDEESRRLDLIISDHKKFNELLNATCDELLAGTTSLSAASRRVLEAAQTLSPKYLMGVNRLEEGSTALQRVAQNFIRHFHNQQDRNPRFAAVVERLQAELKDITRGE